MIIALIYYYMHLLQTKQQIWVKSGRSRSLW